MGILRSYLMSLLRPQPRLVFRVGPVTFKEPKGGDEMALVLTDEQKVALSVEAKTAAGNPASVEGAPVWTVSDPGIITLVVDPAGFSAVAVTAGPLGPCQITVTADADLGAGVRTITGILDIEVMAAEAATLGIAAGTPELK